MGWLTWYVYSDVSTVVSVFGYGLVMFGLGAVVDWCFRGEDFNVVTVDDDGEMPGDR